VIAGKHWVDQSTAVFTPESFPAGIILFEFTASVPLASHSGLVPFELFREPMIIIGVGDAPEYSSLSTEARKDEFSHMLNELRDQYTRALIHRVYLFEDPSVDEVTSTTDIVQIPRSMSLDQVCASLALNFLDEVASYAKSILPLPSIPSPSVPQDQMLQAEWSSDDVSSLTRQTSANGHTRSSTQINVKDAHRMSMPTLSSSDSSPRNQSPARSPARTFEEINQNTLNIRNDVAPHKPSKLRPGSMAPTRDSNPDRVSVHGFGSDSFNEKSRNKGRARVGVVLASVFMQAGRWHDAFREAVESAYKARAMNDHIWHAKALEITALCMVLLAWSGYEFPVSD
jgi:trafficking protein particle complex subunit 9